MSVSAAEVMKLRERTGSPMMECKKFLMESHGDIEKAIIEMRKSGQLKADKIGHRIAAEGAIVIALSKDTKSAVMIEINSETDFVARDNNFTNFAAKVAQTALDANTQDIESLLTKEISGANENVEEARQHLVAKIGENIQLRRIAKLDAVGTVGGYLHGTRIGVLVSLSIDNETLAKDIAMHIAASRPQVIHQTEVAQAAIDNERDIFSAQARDSGKPQDIINKMIEGRISNFVDEVSLVGQPYVKDPNKKVGQLLKEHQAEVTAFIRFEVGEGIEKREDNFVAEVMAQVRES